jgi:hypothetical protein
MSRCLKCHQCNGGYYAGQHEMSWVECENVKPTPHPEAAAERARIIARLRAEAKEHDASAEGAHDIDDGVEYATQQALRDAFRRMADLLESEGKS